MRIARDPGSAEMLLPSTGLLLRRGLAAAAGLCLLTAAQAQAPACARLQPAQGRQPAYAPASDPPRCEGFFERNVSQPFLELVSLTRAPPGSLAADAQGRLALRGLAGLDLQLTIQPLRSTPLYRVDAALPRGATLHWNAGPMLASTRLSLRDLGLLARAEPAGEVPALAPVGASEGEAEQTAYAVLRPSVAISAIAWRAYRLGQAPGAWQELAGPPLFAWERIALPMPRPADGRGQRIDVRALDAQGQPLPLLQFIVLGPQDDKP
ncbi:hypothetical protein [Roseateles violae]|uniref:Uncharacterized protein n=1 Tax=Roseateles violae TaxID=3058042 RepID=A0ABT8DW23_9BURK|nr:hypothetical protein [Pelomonas sp. PFR6]MDN3921238.1 hypothetical protein [Pelomonas sp. PFR6]